MKISVHSNTLNDALSAELKVFEQQFRYPLNQSWFRITHGDDYHLFYRSLGTAACFVAEDDEGIAGVCCAAQRELHRAGGSFQSALYLGDLKVAPRARGGLFLAQSLHVRNATAVRFEFKPDVDHLGHQPREWISFRPADAGHFPFADELGGRISTAGETESR